MAISNTRKLLLLPGDGIGPEVVKEVKKIIEWLNKNKSLDFKIEEELWSSMKTFVMFLGKLPEYPKCYIHDIKVDLFCLSELYKIYSKDEE